MALHSADGCCCYLGKLVWNKIMIPRYSFILWLVFHRGLRTMDKLLNFGMPVNSTSVLCSSQAESFDHLFFQCDYSFRVLLSVLKHCGWRGFSRSWSSVTDYLIHYSHPNFHHSLLHLGFAVVVYHIWNERNTRIFSNKFCHVRSLVADILHMLKCKLHTNSKFQKLKNKPGFRQLILTTA